MSINEEQGPPHRGGPWWLKLAVILLFAGVLGFLVYSAMRSGKRSRTVRLNTTQSADAKKAKKKAPPAFKPARNADGVYLQGDEVVFRSGEGVLRVTRSSGGVPMIRIFPQYADVPARELAEAQRGRAAILKDPELAAELGLSTAEVTRIRALPIMPTLKRLEGPAEEAFKPLYQLYMHLNPPARWVVEDSILGTVRELGAAKVVEARKNGAEAAGKFNAMLTGEQKRKLAEYLARPTTGPATKPASTSQSAQ